MDILGLKELHENMRRAMLHVMLKGIFLCVW